MGDFLEKYKKFLEEGSTGSLSGFASVEKQTNSGSSLFENTSYSDPREQAIIDSRERGREGSFADKYSLFLKQREVEARREQRAYAEQANPEMVNIAKDLQMNVGDRNKRLEIIRKLNPEQLEEVLRVSAGISQQMGDDRGGFLNRALGAVSRGISQGVSQPIMELAGIGGTPEEIEYIRKLDAMAAQEFDPSRPSDPWYERGPLQAAQMAPWMATVVGGNVAGTAAGKIGGQLLARGAAAGVPGAKTAFQAAGAVGRVPTAVGMKGATTRSVFEGAGGLAGVTAASFPGQYAQEVDSLKELGMQDDWKLRLLAGGTATVGGLVEGIVPNPFAGGVSLKNGAMNAARQYLWEAAKKAPGELSEEYLQGVTSGLGQYVAQYVDENAKDKTIADAFLNGWEQTKEAALPMAFLLGTPAVGGAGLSAIRARKYQLEQIKAKNFVSESDAQEAGIEGTSRRERMANVDAEIEQLTASESEAVAQSDREFISQQQGGQAPPMQGDDQFDEAGGLIPQVSQDDLDREFAARMGAQGGNVSTPPPTGTPTVPPVAPAPTVQPPQIQPQQPAAVQPPVPPVAPAVEPPQAPPVAQQPQPLYEVAGDENMVARVWPNPRGFLVNVADMDSGEVDTRATIFPTFEQAKQHADTIRLPSQPQAPPPVAPLTDREFAEQKAAEQGPVAPPIEQPRFMEPTSREEIDAYPQWTIYKQLTSGGDRFAIRQPKNKKGYGDTLESTLEAAEKSRDEMIALAKANAEFQASQKEKEDQQKAKKDAEATKAEEGRKRARPFLDQLSKMRSSKAQAALDKTVAATIGGKRMVMSRREFIETIYDQGGDFIEESILDEAARDKMQGQVDYLRRTAPTGNENHPDTKRLREMQKTLKEGGPLKTVLRATTSDGSQYDITKTEFDYGRFLKSQPAVTESAEKPAEKPDRKASIRRAIEEQGGFESNSADNVEAIRNKLYDGADTPTGTEIQAVMDDMRVEAGRKLESEQQKPTERNMPSYRDWRFTSTAKNSGKIVPNKVGVKFSPSQMQSIVKWAESEGYSVSNVTQTGIRVLDPSGNRLDIAMFGIAGVKDEESKAASKRRSEATQKADEDRKAKADGRESASWITDTFGGVINDYNRNALSDYLEGVTDKFDGAVSANWKDGLEKLGALSPEGKIDWNKVRDAYSASKPVEQPATKPTDAVTAPTEPPVELEDDQLPPSAIGYMVQGDRLKGEMWRSPTVGGQPGKYGAFYATNEEGAGKYSRGVGINAVVAQVVELNNPLVVDTKQQAMEELGIDEESLQEPSETQDIHYYIDIAIFEEAKRKGYDGVVYKQEGYDGNPFEVHVFNPPDIGELPSFTVQGKKQDSQPKENQPAPPSDIASAESDMDAAMREEFKRQLGEKDEKQPPKKRPPRKDGKSKKPSSLKKSKGKARKEADNLWDELIKKSQNKLLTGLDPELLTLAARIAIKEIQYGAISFAEFVERSVAKVPDTLLDKLKPYLESAWRTAYDSEMTTDAGGKFDDYMKKPQQPKQEQPEAKKPEPKEQPEAEKESDVDKTLRQAGLNVEKLADGTWQITGNTYEHSKEIGDVKREIRELGGYWDKTGKRWTFKADPRRAIADRLVSKGVGTEPADDGVSAEQMARERARRAEDEKPDIQTTSETYVASVDQSTRDLISRGLKFGMTEEVVNNQIEDVGRVVNAAENGRPMFVVGSAPGTGKTFVLGGVIKELRSRGFKKFVYVTQNQDLVSQVQNNLADYGFEGVEFVTYAKAREVPPNTSGAVLLLDEAHSAKNLERETGRKIAKMVKSADFTVYATATPFENVTQADYIGYSGIFDDLRVEFTKPSSKPGGRPFRNELFGFKAWAWMFGANVFYIKQEDERGKTFYVPVLWWDKHQTSEEDQLAANEWLKKRGVFVQRPMALPEGTVNSELRLIDAEPYWAEVSNKVAQVYADLEAEAESGRELGQIKAHKKNVLKRLLEAAKVDAAIARAKELIGEGKKDDPQVIIFVNTKEDSEIGNYRLSDTYRKQNRIKGKDAKRRYTLPEMNTMMERWYEAKAIAKEFGGDAGPPPFAKFVHKVAIAMDASGVIEKLPSVIDKIMGEFPGQAVEYSGRTASQNSDNLAKWKNNEAKLIVATMDKGGTGLSFHDTTGKMPSRYQVNMNLPWSGTKVEQVSGRLARYGTAKPVNIEWLFASNIPFDRELSKTVGSRMRSMAAAVQGRKSGEAKQIRDFDFEESPVVDDNVSVAPWSDATVEDEGRWAGTSVNVSAKGKEEGYAGKVVRVLNKGETIEVQRDGFDAAVRVPAERVSVVDLVDSKFVSSAEQADKAAKILADMESNQEKMRQDKRQREGEKLANWVKAFEGSPREVTAAKDLFRKDFEKARENGVSDDRLIEIVEHGQANEMFTEREAADLKNRIKPAKQRHELLLDRAAPYVEKGDSYKRDIADPAMRLQTAIAKGNAIDSSLVQTLTDELEVRLDYWEPILQKAKEENEARDQEDEERPDTGTVGQDRGAISGYGVKGKSTSVITADKSTRRATYYAVEADSLIPSHDARKNFAKNEGSLENERPYEDPKEGADSRKTVRDIAEVDEKKKYLLTSDTMSPTDGPPIVDLYGRVLGGNARSMGMQLAYAGPNAETLRSHIRAEGVKFEIPQEQLDALRNPVIIRVMEEPFDENTISSLLNDSLMAAKSQATVVVSQSKRLSEETIDLVASILGAETEPSLREVMANPRQSTRIVQAIVRDGAWSDKDIAVYVDPGTGDLTAEGKLAIENMLVARVIPNVSLLGDVAPSVKQKILSAIGPLTKGMANEKFGKELSDTLFTAIEAYDGYIADRKTNSLQSYFFDQKQLIPAPGSGNVAVAGIVHALADFTPTKFRNAMRDAVESLGIGERTPSLFGDDVTYDTIEDAVRNVINPPLRRDTDLLMQLDDRITDPPQSLFQSDPNIDATIRSKALDLGIAANEAGITAFDDFVRYSLERNGEKLTRYMGAYLAMVGKAVGMTGIRPVKDILGVPMTQAEYVQLGKETFASVPAEQVEAGIEAAMLTGLPQMAAGFAPAGSPVPGQGLMQGATQTDTPAFKKWFGDSKVVDKDGEPLVVYHGTVKTFDEFFQKEGTKSPSKLIGFFFSPSAKMASDHVARRSGGEPGSQVYPVYLSVKNPYVESVMDHMDMNVWPAAKIKKWKQSLIDEGYDGIYIEPSRSMPGYEDGVWVAFNPTQIKSATGNRGTFDPNNPNMLYQQDDAAYLDAVERGDMKTAQKMVDERLARVGAYWHGTPSGDLRGGVTGLHVGTKQAATEALEARIGIPADGKGWDGTREYAKTLLAGKDLINSGQFGKYRLSGYNMNAPDENYYPTKMPTVGSSVPVDPSWKPWVRPVLIVGETTNTPRSPISDAAANRRIKRKRGAFYTNEGEDAGSVSAVLPSGDSVRIKLADPVTYNDSGSVIPLSQRFDDTRSDIRFQRQSQGGNVKGWTKFISGTRALIGATNKADISTVIHEYAHVIRRFLLDRDVPQYQRIDITDEEISMLEEKCGVKDGNWDVPAEEKFAKMWEQYFFEGKSPNTLLDSLFEKISRWMRQVYQSAMSITGGTLDPEVSKLFDKMVQRGLPADQRTGTKSRDGGAPPVPTERQATQQADDDNLTSVANAYALETRMILGLPGFADVTKETFQEWIDQALQILRKDPTYGNRLVKELAQSNRNIDKIETAVLELHLRSLKNLSDAAADRLFAAVDAKDDVAAVQARRESDLLINEIEEVTDVTNRVGTEQGRSLAARKIVLRSDFTLAGLRRTARVANAGQPLNEEQSKQIEELAKQIATLEGDLAKETQKNDDLARQLAAKESIDDTQKQVGKPVRNTATNRAVKKVENFVNKFVNIFGKRDDTTTLQQTEDERMAEDGEEVIKSFVEAGVYSFGEFMSKFKAVIKGDVPVAARAALRKAWEKMKSQGDIPAPEMSDERQTAELRRLAKIVERNLVEFGITDPEEVIDGVHEALQEVFEDVTRREAMDAMSGYGQYSTPSQEPNDKIIRDLNAQFQQMAKLDDMKQGIAPKKSGRGRDEPSPDLRELIREVNEMKRNSKYFVTDPEAQLKTIFQATRTALKNRIYDLDKAIKTKEPIPGRTPNTFENEQAKEIESLRKQRDELMADYKATFPKPELTFEQRAAIAERAVDREITKIEQQLASGNVAAKERAEPVSTPALKDKQNRLESLRAQREAVREMQMTETDREQRAERLKRQAEKVYVANLLNRIADYEDRKRQGYFGPKEKKEPRELSPREIELSRLLVNRKDEFFRLAAEYRLKNMSKVERFWDRTKETMHLSRAIMTSFDLSAVFRQGGIASLAHPRLAAAASREMWDALRNQNAEFDTMDKIEKDALYAFAMQCGLPITTDKGKIQRQEEAYAGRMVKYGIGKKGTKLNTWSKWLLRPVTASGRAYTTFLNSMRFRLFKYMVSNLGAGGAVTVDEGKVIASYISAATGRADLGKFNQAAANLNTVFFAPRYVASRFQYLAMPFYLLPSTKVSGRVKKMIAMEYARHAMGLTAFLGLSVALASLLTDDEEEKPTVEFDPRSSDFMKLKIGDTRIDPMAGLSQTVTLIGQMATGQKKGLRGDIKDLYGENRKFGDPDLWDVGTGFLRKKLAPIPGAIVDLRVGENVIGEKETVLSATTDLFVPLSFQEAGETMKARGLVGGSVVTALSLLGMGGGTYGPKTQYATADATKREELFKKDLENVKWDDPDLAYKDFLTTAQLDKFNKQREGRKQSLVFSAAADPKRKDYNSDETYKKSVEERDKALEAVIKASMGPRETQLLLIGYFKRNYGSAYEVRGGVYQMKESLINRLRAIRRKMNEKQPAKT